MNLFLFIALVRLNLANGSSLKIEADDVRFVWPIPKHELESPGSQIQPNESNK